MAKIDLTIPSLGDKFVDLRDQLPGDAYHFSWERDFSQVNFLAIHHSASSFAKTPQDIANDHVAINGWGGIGYHFVIAKDGTVYYVGDITTARANVANLNEAVIGICLIGNFTAERVPSNEQLDSAHKLCEFLIMDYPDLPNVSSWDKLRGHKELPNQSTICPGDNWVNWRIQIVEGVNLKDENNPESAIESLQTSLASINQQLITQIEAVTEREEQIKNLKALLSQNSQVNIKPDEGLKVRVDGTLTLTQALVNLYLFVFPPREES